MGKTCDEIERHIDGSQEFEAKTLTLCLVPRGGFCEFGGAMDDIPVTGVLEFSVQRRLEREELDSEPVILDVSAVRLAIAGDRLVECLAACVEVTIAIAT